MEGAAGYVALCVVWIVAFGGGSASSVDDQVCASPSDGDCNDRPADGGGNKYAASQQGDVRWQPYLHAIGAAMAQYKECPDQNCSCFQSQWESDLEPFKDGIDRKMIEEAKDRGVHYQIIDHKLYRQEKCMFGPRCEGVEHFILELIDELPDMEFILNDRDYPQVPRRSVGNKPIFSFSKTSEHKDIMYPAWSFWSGGPAISLHPTGIGRWDKLRDSINKAAERAPWSKKEAKAFFRGSRTSAERDPLVLLSREKPHMVEARYTKNQAWRSLQDTLGEEPASEVHFEDHCKYKYLFNFRGVAASFRLKHLFLCRSAVFHVGDEWLEFFYGALKPWVHYVPISTSLAELQQLLDFAAANDFILHLIASRFDAFPFSQFL
uniref:Glycosyl transferase CAP10 domain-containing protein n=1 Tax=Plectus sambesii TaxID=2011161 RepID=A0A914WRT2_9BILA